MSLTDYKGVTVFVEQRDNEIQNVSLELIGKATKLAAELETTVTAVLLGHQNEMHGQLLISYGADKAIIIDDQKLAMYSTEPYTQALTQVINDKKPEIVLFGATSIGRDLAPRVSARLQTGLTADCTSLEISDEKGLLMTRPAFGGNIMATIVSPNHRPQMSTVRPGVMAKLERDDSRTGEVEKYDVNFEENNCYVEILSFEKAQKEKVDIQDADILISGGRGMGAKENLKLLHNLADEISGTVSSSRALVDAGWVEHDRQVGQTGKTVRPNLYMACGISGAIQHLAGMEESELIIAINKDANAPIFEVADLGIVGDVHKILPLVTERIKKINQSKHIEK